jgi:hypothetical protein
MLLSLLCTRETLAVLASRNGGCSWTQDFVELKILWTLHTSTLYMMVVRKALDGSNAEPVIICPK